MRRRSIPTSAAGRSDTQRPAATKLPVDQAATTAGGAGPPGNARKYTMADVLASRLKPRPIRALAALSTITVSTFYMIAQMVGAGSLVKVLLPGIGYNLAVCGVGVLMIIYVVFGGMLATTWVQIIKAILLMAGTILLSLLVLAHFGWSLTNFFEPLTRVTYHEKGALVTKNFLQQRLQQRLIH